MSTHPSKGTTKVQLGEPVSFIGVPDRSRNNSKIAHHQSCQHGWQLTTARNLELTAQPLATPQVTECLLQSAEWSEPLPGCSGDLRPFQVDWLVWVFLYSPYWTEDQTAKCLPSNPKQSSGIGLKHWLDCQCHKKTNTIKCGIYIWTHRNMHRIQLFCTSESLHITVWEGSQQE